MQRGLSYPLILTAFCTMASSSHLAHKNTPTYIGTSDYIFEETRCPDIIYNPTYFRVVNNKLAASIKDYQDFRITTEKIQHHLPTD